MTNLEILPKANETIEEALDIILKVANSTRNISDGVNGTQTFVSHHVAKYLTFTQQAIITACYLLGVMGNLLALIFLCKKRTKPNNSKHRLMLRCLSANDLVAMFGMMVQMYMQLYIPTISHSIWFCRFRVVWRVFGLGSGCVAIVMAVERWLALTKPFFYQKNVTAKLLGQCIFTLWTLALIMVCLPFFGFGLYYEPATNKCVRYRMATSIKDIIYAYLYVSLGLILCICIVCCNLAVMRSLCNKDEFLSKDVGGAGGRNKKAVLMRRVSRSCSKASTTSTREELAFGRLMGFLCIIFVVCWIPQLITIPLAQMEPHTSPNQCSPFFRIADMLMALHFLLDPYVYVLQRWSVFRSIFYPKKRSTHFQSSKYSVRLTSYDHSIVIPHNHR